MPPCGQEVAGSRHFRHFPPNLKIANGRACKDTTITVTISWDSSVRDFGVSPERALIGYTATYTFIWCDAFDDNQFWWVDEWDLQPVYEPLLP